MNFPPIFFPVRMCIVQYLCVVNTDQIKTCILDRTASVYWFCFVRCALHLPLLGALPTCNTPLPHSFFTESMVP